MLEVRDSRLSWLDEWYTRYWPKEMVTNFGCLASFQKNFLLKGS